MENLYEYAFLIMWLVFSITILIIYHKLFRVYYFSVTKGLADEILKSLLLGLFLTFLTIIYFKVALVIIAITGLICLFGCENKNLRVGIIILFTVCGITIFKLGNLTQQLTSENSVQKVTSNQSEHNITVQDKTDSPKNTLESNISDSKGRVAIEDLLKQKGTNDVKQGLNITESKNLLSDYDYASNWIAYDGFIWSNNDDTFSDLYDSNYSTYFYIEKSGMFITGDDVNGVQCLIMTSEILPLFEVYSNLLAGMKEIKNSDVNRYFSLYNICVGDERQKVYELLGAPSMTIDNLDIYQSPIEGYINFFSYTSSGKVNCIMCCGDKCFRQLSGCTINDFKGIANYYNSNSYNSIFDNNTTTKEDSYSDIDKSQNNFNFESEYILPESSIRILTMDDLQGLDKEQAKISRNEIYARHGRLFKNPQLQDYFNQCSWYYGTIAAEDFSESMLNEYEKANVQLIKEYENIFN